MQVIIFFKVIVFDKKKDSIIINWNGVICFITHFRIIYLASNMA